MGSHAEKQTSQRLWAHKLLFGWEPVFEFTVHVPASKHPRRAPARALTPTGSWGRTVPPARGWCGAGWCRGGRC